VVLRREVLSQQADGGQGQGARSQELEDLWEAPAGPNGLDAVTGGIFGEPKGLGAIAEERAVALSEEERRSAIERGQMSDQLDRGLALLAGEGFQAGEEVLIRQCGGGDEDVVLHASLCITTNFGLRARPWHAPRAPFEGRFSAREDFSPEANGRAEESAKQAL